ncbi:MAG: zinc-binding dehydrogenase [Planctomycetota bacterium]|nr:zinc-binding dehydrogenase [Planctomycetota bacterium]
MNTTPTVAIPKTSQAAVFSEVGKPLASERFELPERLEPGAMLCKVRMSTICGSDLHTIFGRRQEPAPLILGHEVLGEIISMGEQLPQNDGPPQNGNHTPLSIGDRVTWSIMASCGTCFYCRKSLPQKCKNLVKYGHTCCRQAPHLTGGYAEHICLLPGTAVYRVPDGLSDEVATPANCALSTMVNAVEAIGLAAGETVLIQGAGMLGLNLIALCKEAGADKVIVTDVGQRRLEFASRFGADACYNPTGHAADELVDAIRSHTGGHGVDVAFEVCGNASVVDQAVKSLRIGGRYLIAGLVTPGSDLGIDGNLLARNYLTVKGIHNYHPDHLAKGLAFLEQYSHKYPFAEMVGARFPLAEINEAIEVAASGEHIRVAIC